MLVNNNRRVWDEHRKKPEAKRLRLSVSERGKEQGVTD